MMTGTKFDIEKFDGMNDFGLWQVRMKALLEQQGLAAGGKKLYTFHVHPGKSQSEHIDEFHKLVGDLAAINTVISDEDRALLLLTSLPSSYDKFVDTLLYGRDTLKLEDVLATLNSWELQKMTEAKGDGGEGLYVRGRSGQRDMEHDTYSAWSKSQGRSSQVSGSGIDGYDNADVMMAMKYDGGNILLGDDKECCVRRTGEVQVQMRNGSSFVLDNVSDQEDIEGSTQQRTKSGVAKHLGVAGLQQQNGLVEEINVTLLAKGVEFEVEPHEDHAFEVEPQGNVDHVAGSHKIQTQDLMEYHSARDREQHSARELFGYREDSNEAAYAFVVVDKIYAHELLTFNDTVSCEVISKWKAALKEYMDARSDVYVLSNSCRKSSEDINDYYWEYTPECSKWSCIYADAFGSQEYQVVCTRPDIASAGVDMLDVFDRGLQKNVQVFMNFDYTTGRSITVMIRSITGHGLMILGCAGSLKANLQHIEALTTTEARYMTFTEAKKKEIWLKGLLTESGYELRLVGGIATGALVKGCSWFEVPAQVKVTAY
ncbi:hypothetical protein Tco_1280940 [Tanacetum coccineum]